MHTRSGALGCVSGGLVMHIELGKSALALADSGLAVFPVAKGAKTPLIAEWQSAATADHLTIAGWWARWPDANIAIHCGKSGLVVIDIDPRNGGDSTLERLCDVRGDAWQSPYRVTTGGDGIHLYYIAPLDKAVPSTLGPGIDVKRENGYVLAPPSLHPSGKRYAFDGCTLIGGELDFVPGLPEWCCGAVVTVAAPDDWTATVRQVDPETPENVQRVVDALGFISADCSRDEWRNMLFAVLSTGWSCATDICRDWSLTAPDQFDDDAFQNIVDSAKDKPDGITLGTLFKTASNAGWVDPRKHKGFESYGDISNGRRFADRFRGKFLFVHASSNWYTWDRLRWQPCQAGEAMAAAKVIADECLDEAHGVLKSEGTEAAKRGYTQALSVHRSIQKLEAMLKAAGSEPGMSIAHPGLFDSDPLTLNVRNGALDLRSGRLLPAMPEMMGSRLAGAEYDPLAQCPMWTGFLASIMHDDSEMVGFLQRICGYALTGFVDEEKLFFFYGTGANGKSVFANVLLAVFGEYGVTVRAALLARDPRGSGGDAEREKARLPGSRVALMNETGQADVWDDQRTKEIVSRENISARQLYGESFEFRPTHKLVIRGNHQPGAMDGSDGFWRRIVLIGFTRQFAEHERVPDLDRQIIDHELPGVLAWMVDGCLAWQKHGLQTPAKISAAVNAYRKDTDLLGEWLESECVRSTDVEGISSELFTNYIDFLKAANVKAPSRSVFGRQLVQRGFRKRESNGKTFYVGLTIRCPFEPDEL